MVHRLQRTYRAWDVVWNAPSREERSIVARFHRKEIDCILRNQIRSPERCECHISSFRSRPSVSLLSSAIHLSGNNGLAANRSGPSRSSATLPGTAAPSVTGTGDPTSRRPVVAYRDSQHMYRILACTFPRNYHSLLHPTIGFYCQCDNSSAVFALRRDCLPRDSRLPLSTDQ